MSAIVEQIAEAASRPLSRAITLPPRAYTDEGHFAREADAILRAEWICIAHVSQLPAAGDYVAVDLLDEPLVALRGRDGLVRVLSRVCPHRAADILPVSMDVPREGHLNSLVCPYHRWAFDFDGALKGCPAMERAEDFAVSGWRLAELHCEIWEGFVFVNLDGRATPLREQYAEFRDIVAPWDCARLRLVVQLEWECDFNWKVMVENWMESYHHLGIHHTTLNPIMPAQTTWTEPEHPHFIRAHLPYAPAIAAMVRAAAEGGPPMPGFRPIAGVPVERQLEWGLFLGLPCFMFLTAGDRVIWYRLLPDAAGKCRLLTTMLVAPEAIADPEYRATLAIETEGLRAFHVEDMQINRAVQRGLRSAHAVRGRLSHLEEPVWLIQRYVARRLAEHAA